ncbi:flavin reductase family protein [Burkholderia sp. Ax-1719]|jgi:flavin-dependent trigonelline monooxygenase, reductase component|uniref:flavin reductase family protein n=1 Tax=Burkholderia sp. Ax-1719 TaxID=2608334 RepID=UPI00141DA81A|nr:flavin reductase family protein [Burkholderia sp. Ax-1719]NIE62501.1 flavin reductase family protein [Burkholderia sp. Ax-1719]
MTSPNTDTFDTTGFRNALGAFVTGVTVVTTIQSDGTPRGFTANSFTSVSLDPPLVLVCVAKSASSYEVFSQAPQFAVSVLAEDQKDVSGVFASKSPDKFAQVAWQTRATGAPVMHGAAAHFDCSTQQVIDAGDHIILLGRVLDFAHTGLTPLGYCRGAYVSFSLSQDAIAASAASEHAHVGAILENSDGVVLLDTPDGLRLPSGTRLEAANDPSSLRGVLASLGLVAHLDFIFAVFESTQAREQGGDGVRIFYRGRVVAQRGMSAPELNVVPLSQVPWDEMSDPAERSMLQRYVKERHEDAFGVYVGDSEAGTVQTLALT